MSFQISMIIISAIFLGFAISSVNSIECFRCDSSLADDVLKVCATGPYQAIEARDDCDRQMRSKQAKPVSSQLKAKNCLKVVGTDSDGTEYVARSCIPYPGGKCEDVVKSLGFFRDVSVKTLDCHECSTDECNSSFNIKPCMAEVIILSILSFVFFNL